jgi:hypothetical protein
MAMFVALWSSWGDRSAALGNYGEETSRSRIGINGKVPRETVGFFC